MSEYILEGKNLSKSYHSNGQELIACRNVDFAIKRGETIGIVGESGCGKSTLLKMLVRLETPTEGELYFKGENVTHQKGKALRESRKHIQMVFQDPSTAFSPRMKVRDVILEPLKNFFQLTKKEMNKKVEELLELVQLAPEFANRYCHEMSGGQRQRLGIARALATEPEVLVCDEATCALDVSIQDNIMKLLVELQQKKNLSIIFICHDIALVSSISHKMMIMYLGTIVEIVESRRISDCAVHPYSKQMIASIFSTTMDFSKEIQVLEGDVPNPLNAPEGCVFSTRCSKCEEKCRLEKPKLKKIGENHEVACYLNDYK